MSEKLLDAQGRHRKTTASFRVSPEEAEVLLNDELGTDSSAIAQTCALAIGLFVAADGDSAVLAPQIA